MSAMAELAVSMGMAISLAELPVSNPFLAAVNWLEAVALGTIATSIALVAVATIGLLMFSGRVPVRRGGTVLAGCFLLFGAPLIAAGILRSVGSGDQVGKLTHPVAASPLDSIRAPESPPNGYDPYAGAAVPPR